MKRGSYSFLPWIILCQLIVSNLWVAILARATLGQPSSVSSWKHHRPSITSGGDNGKTQRPPLWWNQLKSRIIPSSLRRDPSKATAKHANNEEAPILYRYWSRRNNVSSQTSIPFLLLGPNVHHWKVVGTELSNRGYNVMAYQRNHPEAKTTTTTPNHHDTRILIQILDTLKWHKVVVVVSGSPQDTTTAIVLALCHPQRIAGLVLCAGTLPTASAVQAVNNNSNSTTTSETTSPQPSLEQYLQEHLNCPFLVVWDGAVPPLDTTPYTNTIHTPDSSSVPDTTTTNHRVLLLGGGSAPHRRKPQLLAWHLTRFVEQHILAVVRRHDDTTTVEQQNNDSKSASSWWIVSGRLVATILWYAILLKILSFQYDHVKQSWRQFRVLWSRVGSWVGTVAMRILSVWMLPVRMVRRRVGTKHDASSRDGGNSSTNNNEDATQSPIEKDTTAVDAPHDDEEEDAAVDEEKSSNPPKQRADPPRFSPLLDPVVV